MPSEKAAQTSAALVTGVKTYGKKVIYWVRKLRAESNVCNKVTASSITLTGRETQLSEYHLFSCFFWGGGLVVI